MREGGGGRSASEGAGLLHPSRASYPGWHLIIEPWSHAKPARFQAVLFPNAHQQTFQDTNEVGGDLNQAGERVELRGGGENSLKNARILAPDRLDLAV